MRTVLLLGILAALSVRGCRDLYAETMRFAILRGARLADPGAQIAENPLRIGLNDSVLTFEEGHPPARCVVRFSTILWGLAPSGCLAVLALLFSGPRLNLRALLVALLLIQVLMAVRLGSSTLMAFTEHAADPTSGHSHGAVFQTGVWRRWIETMHALGSSGLLNALVPILLWIAVRNASIPAGELTESGAGTGFALMHAGRASAGPQPRMQ